MPLLYRLRPANETSGTDVAELRSQHARSYVLKVLPLMIAFAWALVAIAFVVRPSTVDEHTFRILVPATIAAVASAIAVRWIDPVLDTCAALGFQLVLIAALTVTSERPEQDVMLVLWPIVALAYFGSPQLAAIMSVAVAIGIVVIASRLPNWTSMEVIPVPAYVIAIAGLLVSFVTRQGRRVERALVAVIARDRIALALSRGIRLAEDPRDAMAEIARTLGAATCADHAVVALFEHDEDYVTEVATWSSDDERSSGERTVRNDSDRPDFDIASIDATLRHLVVSGHGALLDEHDELVLLSPDNVMDELPGSDRSVELSLRELLQRIGARSGLLVPIPLGGRTVGAILLASREQHSWSTAATPLLEPLAPQLGAGLAQVVLLRDQRDALDSLERIDRMRDRLIANVSHELRTPLTSTIGFIETLLRPEVDFSLEQRNQLMLHARDGGLRLLALVEDLLALASTRPESLDLDPEPISASELLDMTIRGIEAPDDRRLDVTLRDDPYVVVDRNRLLQVLSNLLVNAFHHGDGNVELRCFADGGKAIFDVFDDGGGIASEHLSELFLPFARFSTRSDSTGLGLAICRTIVEAHGGSIDYARVPEHRTRFRITLPLAQRR